MKNTLATTCALGLIVTAFAAQAQVTAGSSPRITNAVKPDSTLGELSANNARIKSVLENAKTKAASEGSVKVVVKLDVPYAAPNRLALEEVRLQSAQMTAARGHVLKALPNGAASLTPGFAGKVGNMPYVGLTLNASGVDSLSQIKNLIDIFPADEFSADRDYVQTLQRAFAQQLGIDDAGTTQGNISPQVIGGTPAKSDTHPFQVALVTSGIKYCGGTLIGPKRVVTAAHCVESESKEELIVLVGTKNLSDGSGEKIFVSRIARHPKRDSDWKFNNDNPMNYDIAIIELQRAPKNKVEFATLAKDLPQPKEALKLTGWGTEVHEKPRPDLLLEATLTYMGPKDCKRTSMGGVIAPEMLCAIGKKQSACSGDSGGPLTRKKSGNFSELAGVVSFGSYYCDPKIPSVFANIAHPEIREFIEKTPPSIWLEHTRIGASEGDKYVTAVLRRSSTKGSARVRVYTQDGNNHEDWDEDPLATPKNARGKGNRPGGGEPNKGPFDYMMVDQIATFKDGASEAIVKIPLINDNIKEPEKFFFIVIREPSNGWTLGSSDQAYVTLTDDD